HERKGPDGKPLNLVHRDLSPRAAFITYDGVVKLLGFGAADAARAAGLDGALAYRAPEQIKSEPFDRRADVYALSALLWELTLARALPARRTAGSVARRIVEKDAPAPTSIDRGYPKELERIVLRGLDRAPDKRFATVEELQLALEAFVRKHKLAASPLQ